MVARLLSLEILAKIDCFHFGSHLAALKSVAFFCTFAVALMPLVARSALGRV